MQFCSLASGSNGNCYYIRCGRTGVLVDIGITTKRVEMALREIGVDPAGIRAVLITHEHSDHVQGVGVWARRYRIPILASERTLQTLVSMSSTGAIPPELLYPVQAGRRYYAEDLTIEPFAAFHDAADPLGFSLTDGEKRITIMTDTGMVSEDMIRLLKTSDLAVLESNYDVRMLMTGPYPPQLKKRIHSNVGHLSNLDCGQILKSILQINPDLIVYLGHLSQENNTPELAYNTVRSIIAEAIPPESVDLRLTHRGARTEIVTL
ncbi:MAG: MBL fold metallo-hydrolase [Clostridiales bacterium]|nr:MBL fold metallo-hydrolase [Clostridiales bacterium]